MKLDLKPIIGNAGWTTAQESSCKDKKNGEVHRQKTFSKEIFTFKYCDKIPHKTFFIMFELILSRTFFVEKNYFHIGTFNFAIHFTHRLNFQKQQSITVTFIFSLI